MRIPFGIGQGIQEVEVPDSNLLGILHANEVQTECVGEEAVLRALAQPIGSKPLREMVHAGQKIVVITSDITRPMPTYAVMPALLDEMYAGGARPSDITLVFALGSHRKHTPEEMRKLAGERAYKEIACVDTDPDDCVHMGETSGGTPVDITRIVAQANLRICLGNIEYHYFAGYSGGAKAIMPGSSTREAIQKNHRRMIDARACAGNILDNPLRADIEEAAAICGISFILNVVLDEHKHIVGAFAGDATQAHRAGCRLLDAMYLKPIERRADIVLVSQGGAPKDLNLYQTQKALDNAKHAVRHGGVIILIGSCKEGLGEKTFETWMTTSASPAAMIERIGRDFQLGGHKAAAIAMVLENADVYLVSDLDPAFVEKIFLKPFATAQEAFNRAMEKLGPDATVLAMPYGGSTLPRAKD